MNTYRIDTYHFKNFSSNQSSTKLNTNIDFYHVLEQKIESSTNLKFSKHALDRLEQRNIRLSSEDINKINKAICAASQKGVKETLILIDNKALIASIPNKTIITAICGEQLKNNLFTNIDGAVII